MSKRSFGTKRRDSRNIQRIKRLGKGKPLEGLCFEGFCKRYISEVKGYESTARGLQDRKAFLGVGLEVCIVGKLRGLLKRV